MKRRLVSTLLVTTMLLVNTSTQAHEVGLQLYSLRDQIKEDMPAAFKQINTWGIKVVEGGGALFTYSALDYKTELDKNQIELVSVDTSYDELRDNPIAAVYKAHYYGAKYATFYWIPHDSEKGFSISEAKDAIELMNSAGKLLKQNGVTLQYHPHGYEFLPYENETLLDYMIKNVANAEFQMDVFWVKQAGMDPLNLLRKYPGRFTSLHLKDRKKGSPNSTDGRADVETNVVLGEGDVGIKGIVAEAKKQGIRYFFLEDESSRVLKQVPLSLEYLYTQDEKN